MNIEFLFLKLDQLRRKNAKFDAENEKIGNSFIHSRRTVDEIWLKFWDLSGAEVCKSCRSRQELSNEYLLAKIGVDTSENEPLEVWGENSIQYSLPSLITTHHQRPPT